jgi:hypothetical protein
MDSLAIVTLESGLGYFFSCSNPSEFARLMFNVSSNSLNRIRSYFFTALICEL